MKKFFILTSLLFVLSCNNEIKEGSSELLDIKIDRLADLLPLIELNGKTKAIFIAESGEEKILEIQTSSETKQRKFGDQNYLADEISIIYIDPESDEYSLNILGFGNYNKEGAAKLYISCGITQFTTGYSTIITISESGKPILAQFFDNFSIADIDFEKVFSSFPLDGYNAYAKLYYNSTYGIIGFADKNGVLFALKEIKK